MKIDKARILWLEFLKKKEIYDIYDIASSATGDVFVTFKDKVFSYSWLVLKKVFSVNNYHLAEVDFLEQKIVFQFTKIYTDVSGNLNDIEVIAKGGANGADAMEKVNNDEELKHIDGLQVYVGLRPYITFYPSILKGYMFVKLLNIYGREGFEPFYMGSSKSALIEFIKAER